MWNDQFGIRPGNLEGNGLGQRQAELFSGMLSFIHFNNPEI